MKTKLTLSLGLGLLFATLCGNVSAQTTQTAGKTCSSSCANAKTSDILVVTGKLIDAVTHKPIMDAKINSSKFGEEMLKATVDKEGNYTLALNKKELGEPIRVIFKIAGYKRFVVKSVDKKATHLEADIFLQPSDSDEKSSADVKYIMSDDPFNTMVIKLQ